MSGPAPGVEDAWDSHWRKRLVDNVELYPHFPGLLSGICDQFGHELQFPAAFRQQRGTGLQKGIVKIIG